MVVLAVVTAAGQLAADLSSEKIIGYDVRYKLGDQVGTVRMDRDPGERIPVDENGELQIAGRRAAAR